MWQVNNGKSRTASPPRCRRAGGSPVKMNFNGRDAALMAIDPAERSAASRVIPAAETRREVEIRLAPLVASMASSSRKDLGGPISWTNVYINLLPGKIRLLQNTSENAEFSLLLPPGEYDMKAYGTDVAGHPPAALDPRQSTRRPRPGYAQPGGHFPRPTQRQGTPRLDARRCRGVSKKRDACRLSRQVGIGRLLGPLVRTLRPTTRRADRSL